MSPEVEKIILDTSSESAYRDIAGHLQDEGWVVPEAHPLSGQLLDDLRVKIEYWMTRAELKGKVQFAQQFKVEVLLRPLPLDALP